MSTPAVTPAFRLNKASLRSISSESQLIAELVEGVKSHFASNLERVRAEPDLVYEVVQMVEFKTDRATVDDKLALVTDIYTQIFGNVSEVETDHVKKIARFLYSANLIKKRGRLQALFDLVCCFFRAA